LLAVKIASVVGARPNFIKLAPVHRAVGGFADHTIIHTGQHYDYEMSEIFFKEFRLPAPDYNLDVGSGSPAYQIGETIRRLEPVLLKTDFDLVIVYGDTNSTLAGALAANRLGMKLAHVESGLRSFDRRMPEETNRVLTDHMADYLFAPTRTAVENLKGERVHGKIVYTGDVSVEMVKKASVFASKSRVLQQLGLESKSYMLYTMHRAENTNSRSSLASMIRAFEQLPEIKIIFPIHPRTAGMLKETGLMGRLRRCRNVKIIPPVGYVDFVRLIQGAGKVMTDSGGVQKEAYLLSVPCITIRRNTEWVETVKAGWNILTDTDTDKMARAARSWQPRGRPQPVFGPGRASSKIASFIKRTLAAS
jgi:UDP-N-acetylglucosamine 2-epimerase (non-hydrolysing)